MKVCLTELLAGESLHPGMQEVHKHQAPSPHTSDMQTQCDLGPPSSMLPQDAATSMIASQPCADGAWQQQAHKRPANAVPQTGLNASDSITLPLQLMNEGVGRLASANHMLSRFQHQVRSTYDWILVLRLSSQYTYDDCQ